MGVRWIYVVKEDGDFSLMQEGLQAMVFATNMGCIGVQFHLIEKTNLQDGISSLEFQFVNEVLVKENSLEKENYNHKLSTVSSLKRFKKKFATKCLKRSLGFHGCSSKGDFKCPSLKRRKSYC